MRHKGNTIFITGGGSGIGRGLAEALHKRGNKVIIGGRRRSALEAVAAANPGMAAIELDIADPASIDRAAKWLIAEHPNVNVLINNAGIMQPDQAAGKIDDALLLATVNINLIGSIRMTSALIDHLKTKERAVIAYTSSVLGFVPLALTAVYSSTKAALHSYALSQRFMLRDTNVSVLEIVPPWVRTELMNSQEAQQAMALDQFIAEAMAALATNANEIVVAGAKPQRDNPGPAEHRFVDAFNAQMLALVSGPQPRAKQ
jgi:uncharacterized oxidoreductase